VQTLSTRACGPAGRRTALRGRRAAAAAGQGAGGPSARPGDAPLPAPVEQATAGPRPAPAGSRSEGQQAEYRTTPRPVMFTRPPSAGPPSRSRESPPHQPVYTAVTRFGVRPAATDRMWAPCRPGWRATSRQEAAGALWLCRRCSTPRPTTYRGVDETVAAGRRGTDPGAVFEAGPVCARYLDSERSQRTAYVAGRPTVEFQGRGVGADVWSRRCARVSEYGRGWRGEVEGARAVVGLCSYRHQRRRRG